MPSYQPENPDHDAGPVYSGRDVRQGDIVLSKPWERGVFAAGLIGAVVLALVLVLIGVHFGRAYSDRQASDQPAHIGQVGMINS